ncbi:type I secretion protein ATPase [Pseudophaeobacter profundi]|uniref:type I secretion protein ATPase n=1 Tax=Pseudophaeobacter profundi TaxID=3034152 RepID=UPI00242F0990|nr:type I secretion protein ATPase [Pseudophaeobacter profundi]
MFDKVTEIVAHMIGFFHIAVEEERMRDAYDDFKALQLADAETNDLTNIVVTFKAPYTLTDFTPVLEYTPPDLEQVPQFYGPDILNTHLPYYHPLAEGADELAWAASGSVSLSFSFNRPHLTLEPAGSVVTITIQNAWMEDNDDLFMNEIPADFVDPAEYLTTLQSINAIAQALGVVATSAPLDFSKSTLDTVKALHESMGDTDGTSRIGEIVTVQHGDDAYGSYVNGETVEETPILDDIMPAYFQAENPDVVLSDDAPEDEEDPDALANTDPFQGLDGSSPASEQFEIDDGHHLVTGANVMVNDASISVGWLDAPVISVMGDVVDLNVISQVNVLFEHVTLNAQAGATVSANFNVATMSHISSQPVTDDAAMAEDTGGAPTGLPQNWAVTRIDGDIIMANWVSQFSFMTDHDRADVQFTGSNTQIVMGDNTIVNLAGFMEIGYGYDLVMIGGNMITVNQISQMNVVMDYDTVTFTGDVPFGFSGGDNLLFNGANISTTGIDSYTDMTSNFANASNAFANGATTINDSVAHDNAFAGDDILTVLYISGDFTTLNWLEQTNIMGDSDQVHMALDNFQAQTGASIELVTGSNAAINTASVNIYGVDSEVRVGGEAYSDALLYQANLIDTDADPLGVELPALANEAVAFLAEGMMSPDGEAPSDAEIVATAPEYSGNPDMMQTMLA